MKEELKVEFGNALKHLSDYNVVECSTMGHNSNAFKSVLTGVFAKCMEFNCLLVNKDKEGSFFLMTALRSITEDLIALKFLILKYKGDKNELVRRYVLKNIFDCILSQQEFFKDIGSEQRIMNEAHVSKEMRESSQALKEIWQKHGLNKKREFPSVAQMATDGGLIKLYNYLYSATSSHVHFNPHTIVRTGWTENMNDYNHSHLYSTNNFDTYYENFNLYYGCYLYIEMVSAFKNELNLGKEITEGAKRMKRVLKSQSRIPELVTLEEMNIKRGIAFLLTNFGLEHLEEKADKKKAT